MAELGWTAGSESRWHEAQQKRGPEGRGGKKWAREAKRDDLGHASKISGRGLPPKGAERSATTGGLAAFVATMGSGPLACCPAFPNPKQCTLPLAMPWQCLAMPCKGFVVPCNLQCRAVAGHLRPSTTGQPCRHIVSAPHRPRDLVFCFCLDQACQQASTLH